MRIIRIFILVSFFLLMIAIPVLAAGNTLLGDTSGTYVGGFDILSSQVFGNPGFLIGGFTGKYLNDSLLFGAEGYLLINPIKAPRAIAQPYVNKRLNLGFFYTGAKVEYNLSPGNIVHFSGDLLAVLGFIKYVGKDYDFSVGLASLCYVIEPGVNVMVNVNDSIQAGVGVSYRWVSGLNIAGLTNQDLSGVSMKLVIRFNEF
jgi:hypothetical protein